jgi:hypothetical protein
MSFPLRTRTRGRPGRGAGVKSVAAAPSFNPLTSWTTDPLHGVWASDPLWVPPADGGAVSSWRNGGSVGGDLVQATGSRQPTYDASNPTFNGAAVVVPDGTDDWLAVDFASVAQPLWIVAVATMPGTGRFLSDAGPAGAAGRVGVINSAGNYAIFAPTYLAGTAVSASPVLLVAAVNGGSSSITVNGTSVASGAAGPNSLSGITLFSRYGGSLFANAPCAYFAVFGTNPTTQTEWTAFKAWCLSFYGITVA